VYLADRPARRFIRGQQAGLGLDQIRAFSRHRTLQTMLGYRDQRDQAAVQRQLTDVVAGTLTRRESSVRERRLSRSRRSDSLDSLHWRAVHCLDRKKSPQASEVWPPQREATLFAPIEIRGIVRAA
jgi:hypothetical protein